MDENLRTRLQLSRLLHGVQMDIEEVLGEKNDGEREALRNTVFELIPQGCKSYMSRMKEAGEYNDDDDTDQFLLSPHGVSVVDALIIAIAENEDFTSEQQVALFASLADILYWGIPNEIRWAKRGGREFAVVESLDLIEITVTTAEALNAIHEARHRKSADIIPDQELASKVAEVISEKAKKNGQLAHVEHRAMKETVFEWCEANLAKFKSMDQAAQAIAGVEVPVVFTTARSWIREWKKNNALKSKPIPGGLRAIK